MSSITLESINVLISWPFEKKSSTDIELELLLFNLYLESETIASMYFCLFSMSTVTLPKTLIAFKKDCIKMFQTYITDERILQ